MLIRASLPFRGSDSCFRYGCLAEYTLGTHKHLYACVSLMGRTHTSARQLSQRRRGRGVSNNRFVCSLRPFQKHGCGYTAGALLKRTREQPPLRFHSHVTETMFMIFIISKEKNFLFVNLMGLTGVLYFDLLTLVSKWQRGTKWKTTETKLMK